MRLILLTGLAIAALTTGQAFAGCSEPAAVTDLPNGATASRDDMLAAQRAIRAYDTAVRQYTSCLQQTGDTTSKGNDAVDRLERVAARFNEELKAFKEKNSAT